jgi:hypothetical protein
LQHFKKGGCFEKVNFITENNLLVFPNPANDFLNIKLLSAGKILFVQIIDSQGRLVKSQRNASNQASIDLKTLPCGIYITKVYTENGFIIKKMVKQ